MKSGIIAIVGKPNVGKSSLTNAFVGEKVSIVSPRSQTTRDSVRGIYTDENYQMIFVDTPGEHIPKTKLGEYMAGYISSSTQDVDAVVIVLDATKPFSNFEQSLIQKHLKKCGSVYVAINKVDLAGYQRVYPLIASIIKFSQSIESKNKIKEIVPLSCKTGENIQLLKDFLTGELTDEVLYFDPDDITDKSQRYMVGEIIREKALLFLQDEVPHGIGVYIQSFTQEKNLVSIEADIICERDTHKSIIIGADGEKLKMIGQKARQDIESLLESKVYLKLYVKVRANWRNKKNVIEDIGYKK